MAALAEIADVVVAIAMPLEEMDVNTTTIAQWQSWLWGFEGLTRLLDIDKWVSDYIDAINRARIEGPHVRFEHGAATPAYFIMEILSNQQSWSGDDDQDREEL